MRELLQIPEVRYIAIVVISMFCSLIVLEGLKN